MLLDETIDVNMIRSLSTLMGLVDKSQAIELKISSYYFLSDDTKNHAILPDLVETNQISLLTTSLHYLHKLCW